MSALHVHGLKMRMTGRIILLVLLLLLLLIIIIIILTIILLMIITYIYIYIYRERENDREGTHQDISAPLSATPSTPRHVAYVVSYRIVEQLVYIYIYTHTSYTI